jgi:CheY-like chemotaxis protein
MTAVWEVLVVDDSTADARLTARAFEETRAPIRVEHVASGDDAIDYLQRRGKFSAAKRPDLLLLDLNMPGMDGRELLVRIKSDPQWSRLPVIVLSTSSALSDVDAAYAARANSYLQKPQGFDDYCRMARALTELWLRADARLRAG